MDRLRRRAGAAYARLAASGQAIAHALGVHHTTVTHRKAGQGPLAGILFEIDALTRADIDTEPIFAAMFEAEADARRARERGRR